MYGQVVDQMNVQQATLFNQTPVDVFVRNTSSDTVSWLFGQCRLNDDPNIDQSVIVWGTLSQPLNQLGIPSSSISYPCWDLSTSQFEIYPGDQAQLELHFDLSGTGCETYRFKIIENGNYIDSIDINFCATLGLDEGTLDKMNIWPNPASDEINIPDGIKNIQIFDISGVLVKEEESEQSHSTIDVSSLSAGVYVVRLEGVEGIISTQELVVNP